MQSIKYNSKNHPLFNCGDFNCGICAKAYTQIRIKQKAVKENFSSETVAPFVGRYNYPNLNIGMLAPPEETKDSWMYDAPKYWAYEQLQIPKIVEFRSSLINSRTNLNVKKRDKFLFLNQEASLASSPVDIDITLKKKPSFNMNNDNYMAPTGMLGELKKAKLTENANIHTKVQKVHYDDDLKAADALTYLYDNKFDENFLSKILSVGTLGIGKDRKLVPTRWSITATDDTLGKHLMQKVKMYNEINYKAFFGGYLGNYYLVLCFPNVWSYELFEMTSSNPSYFKTDHEPYAGRKNYAKNTAGGYYTVKLAILEKLNELKRQGSCIALRFITSDYTLPLGVWVTREAARKTLENTGIEFSSKELMLKYSEKLIKQKFGCDINLYLKNSRVLREINNQQKISDFL